MRRPTPAVRPAGECASAVIVAPPRSVNRLRPLIAIDARMELASGIGTYIRNAVPRVAERLVAAGYRVQILSPGRTGSALPKSEGELIVRRTCEAAPLSLREQWAVRRALPRHVQLLWVPHFNVPLLYRGPLFVTVHDVLPLALPKLVDGWHRRSAARVLFRKVARDASAIACDSEFTAIEMARLTTVDPAKLRVIHLGVDRRWFDAKASRDRVSRPYFLFVGNVKPHKNLRALLSAYDGAPVPQDLVLVGRYDGFRTGDAEVARLAGRSEGRVKLLGHVSETELEKLVANADGLVIPSVYEGFGLPAIEAMAAGCPVLASRAASLPEVCGDAAMYFDPNDADDLRAKLVLLGNEATTREALRERGRARAAAFTWDGCADQTAQVLISLLASGHFVRAS